MICRRVFSREVMHTGAEDPHKVAPTAHCTCSRSDASPKSLKYINKATCIFFDQVNNYSNFRCRRQAPWPPSTDLSTDIVDKRGSGCCTRAYAEDLVAMTTAR